MNVDPSLEHLHRQIIIGLASALGNLRMLAIGAPFASELLTLATDDVELALEDAKAADVIRRDLSAAFGPTQKRC